jgi:hypothetical protein
MLIVVISFESAFTCSFEVDSTEVDKDDVDSVCALILKRRKQRKCDYDEVLVIEDDDVAQWYYHKHGLGQ